MRGKNAPHRDRHLLLDRRTGPGFLDCPAQDLTVFRFNPEARHLGHLGHLGHLSCNMLKSFKTHGHFCITPSPPTPSTGQQMKVQIPTDPELLLRLNTIALAVADLRAMVWWYRRVLDLRLVAQGHIAATCLDYAGLEGSGFRLELSSHPGMQRPRKASTNAETTGWRALVLETDDLLSLDRRLARNSVEVIWSQKRIEARLSTMIRDPEGNLIQILGPEHLPPD
jgi:catechol 2,3-dioxygenase-like lactoylglutathione lyase family enzyme